MVTGLEEVTETLDKPVDMYNTHSILARFSKISYLAKKASSMMCVVLRLGCSRKEMRRPQSHLAYSLVCNTLLSLIRLAMDTSSSSYRKCTFKLRTY